MKQIKENIMPTILQTLSDEEIISAKFPEPVSIIPGLHPEGLSIVAGKPKIGKSWYDLNLAVAVAKGGKALNKISVDQHEVLYFPLEDRERRVQDRLKKILRGEQPTGNLHFVFQWQRREQSIVQTLENWLAVHEKTKLIIIDTLARIRNSKSLGLTLYDHDYEELARLKTIADKSHIAIIVNHHLRKMTARDNLDLINGSTGLTAAADTIVILSRDRTNADATLFVSGRDVEEKEFAMQFDGASGIWSIIGQAAEYQLSPEKQEIYNFLKENNASVKLQDICKAVGKKGPVIHKHLQPLIDQELIVNDGYGSYRIKGESGESSETTEIAAD